MQKSTWSNYKRSGIWVDPPPCFFKIPTFSRYFFWGASLTLIFEQDRFSSGATQSRFASRWFENPRINVDRIVGGQQASNRYVWPFRALCLRLTFSTTQSECNISLFRFPNLFIAFFLPNRFETRPSLSCTVHLYHHPVCRHLHQKNGVKSSRGCRAI